MAQVDAVSQALVGELKEMKMKTLTKAVIGISAGAAYVGVQKIRHRVSDEPENRDEFTGL